MAQAEARLVKKIIKAVKAAFPGAIVWKLSDRFNRGLPDLMIIFPRVDNFGQINGLGAGVLFVEVKTIVGKLTKIQKLMLSSLDFYANSRYIRAIKATTPEEVISKMKSM